jgi:hypothetical protein
VESPAPARRGCRLRARSGAASPCDARLPAERTNRRTKMAETPTLPPDPVLDRQAEVIPAARVVAGRQA